MAPFRAILLPGSVLPGDLAYGPLVAALGETDALVKELEVYATPEAPPDYTLDLEVGGVLRDADERVWERFRPNPNFEEPGKPLPAVRAPGEGRSCLQQLAALAAT